MGLFSRSNKKAKNVTIGNKGFYLGRSNSGKIVTERSSMQVTAVYACVRVLAEAVASLPLHLYRADDTTKVKATDNNLYFLLHDEPNPEMTSYTFRETMMTNLLLYGNAYAQIVRNLRGDIVGIYPLQSKRMTVGRTDDTKQIYYSYWRGAEEATPTAEESVILPPSEILHIPALGFDGLIGYSPIAMAKNAIGMSLACEEFGAKFFENGATPSAVLEHPGTIKDAEKLRQSWSQAFGGSANSHKVAVLEEGLKYTPISINPSEAQFLETRKFQIDEIARIFRVPPHMIGDLDHSTFSNIEQQSLEFVTYTLQPWLVRWEQAMKRSLLTSEQKKDMYFNFNVDGLLRGDYQSRMSGYATGISNGFMSPNDVRRLENMDLIPPEKGGDTYMVNGSMTPLEATGAAYGINENGENEQ